MRAMRTLKQLLKHNALFRHVFAMPLAARSKWISRRSRACATLYRQAVVGGEIIVRATNIPGRFAVPAHSDVAVRIITQRCYEPEVTECLRRLTHLGGDIINIGANVGLFAIFLARQCASARMVYAVEPNPEAFDCLRRNIALNGMEGRIRPVQACIGATAGETEFAFIPGMPEYSSLGGIVHSSVKDRAQSFMRVPVAPLDVSIGTPDLAPSLLVVDTEGAELLVFEGASAILTKYRPLLLFECSDHLLRKFGHSSQRLADFLESHDYAVRVVAAPRLSLTHPFDGEALGVPRETLAAVVALLTGGSPPPEASTSPPSQSAMTGAL